jgi:NADPH:quinone reductase-like Zn-dependent oxidoreductase
MKAIIVNESGGLDKLKYVDLPLPEIKENEVLVKVKAISVNPVDFKTRKSHQMLDLFYGTKRPVVLGWDISGVVETSNSPKFKVGDKVFGMVNFPGNGSGYAEYVAASAEHLAIKPEMVSHEAAAAATLAALTAWQALVTFGNLTKGQKVLIHAASGGVGHYAIQLGKSIGLFVIGTSSSRNKAFVLANGADQHIAYDEADFTKVVPEVDFVLDAIGGENILKSVQVTKPGGKVITITGGNTPQAYLDEAAKKDISLSFIMVKSSGADMEKIADLLEQGLIKSQLAAIFPFDELPKSHEALETGRTVGKIVVTV